MRTKSKRTNLTSDAVKILDSITGNDPVMQHLVEEALLNAKVAQQIYALRTQAGLSQTELAKKVGTTQSVISRLEDADYEGHSLSMLQRIAGALDNQLEIRFIPLKRQPQLA